MRDASTYRGARRNARTRDVPPERVMGDNWKQKFNDLLIRDGGLQSKGKYWPNIEDEKHSLG